MFARNSVSRIFWKTHSGIESSLVVAIPDGILVERFSVALGVFLSGGGTQQDRIAEIIVFQGVRRMNDYCMAGSWDSKNLSQSKKLFLFETHPTFTG